MTEKTPVKLIVSDIDNTIYDFFNIWGVTTEKAVSQLAASRGIDKDKLYENMRDNTSGFARFHSISTLIKETPMLSLEGKSPEEAARLEKLDAKLIHDIQKERTQGNKVYEGVIATVRKAKAAGSAFVLYTDAPISGAIERLADMKFPIDLIDGMVSRADHSTEMVDGKHQFKKAPMQVKGSVYDKYRDSLVEKLGDNLVLNASDMWKPNTTVMQGILDRHGAKAEETVMVGDNIRSDGGAVALGCHFAWQKEGAEVWPEVKAMSWKMNEMPTYKVGVEGHLEQLADIKAQKPELGAQYDKNMVTLEGGFKDLNKHFRFASIEKAKEQTNTNTAFNAGLARRKARGM